MAQGNCDSDHEGPEDTPRTLRVLVIEHAGERREVEVTTSEVTFGRGPEFAEDALHIDLSADDTVSRRHGKMTVRPDWACIVDLDSTNGTRLNDVRLKPFIEIVVKHGDVITLGQNTHIECRA